MTDELSTLLRDQAVELLNNNASGISDELSASADGKLSVSMGFKLCLLGRKIVCDTAVAYSRKFNDDTQGIAELPDPNQPELLIETAARDLQKLCKEGGVSSIEISTPGMDTVKIDSDTKFKRKKGGAA